MQTRTALLLVVAAVASPMLSMTAHGAEAAATDDRMDRMQREMDALREQNERLARGLQDMQRQNQSLETSLSELQAQNGEKWLSEQRAAEIREVVSDVLADSATRSSLQAAQMTGGYDKGFFLASPDGNFKLKLGGQLQARWAASFYSTRDDNILNMNPGAASNRGTTAASVPALGSFRKSADGFEIRRMKLDFSGHVVDPSWQYRIVVIYDRVSAVGTPSNSAYLGGVGAAGGAAGVEDAYVRKDLGNGFALWGGQFKAPFLKEELTSSKYQLAAERSLVNYMFTTKFTQGVELEWTGESLRALVSYNDGGNNSTYGAVSSGNNGTNPNTTQNNGDGFAEWAVTGRVAWLAWGNWKMFDDMNSYRGEGDGLQIGAAFNWQRGGQQTSSFTNTAANPAGNLPANGNSDATMLSWEVDAQWNLGGANLFSQFVMNTAYAIPSAKTSTNAATAGNSDIASYGLIVQGGYFVTDEIEPFARWEWMETANQGWNNLNAGANASNGSTPNANVFNAGKVQVATIGMNWFLQGSRNLKFTLDYGWTFSGNLWFNNGIFGQNVGGADYRIEPKGGGNQNVVRAQMQLLF